ncbi:disease resistance protein RUN1-like isoform X2 [Malus sylvestris]|uniref:disease resistance protein RUN1-like isoform X2 n=1 Tax=Malus sylvestris TaxID=3752 RepID=UPI0021AD3224|nr:disease resistance protein RUN1-like isoform X2 [Malus sylvestris]
MNTSTSSSSSLKPLTYDVYLSFRGQDTRNFVEHLHLALVDAGLNAFIDSQLRRGEDISFALNQAIEGSKSSIIVFSKNYAESRWCLDELVKIMEFGRTVGQIIFPIFYGVDPSDVMKQTGTLATAFLKHEQLFYAVKEKLKLWRSALAEAGNLAGLVVRDGDEVNVEIVAHMIQLYLQGPEIGIRPRVREISNYLDVGGSDVRIIGIWGMGGLGKTQVAKAIFNKYQDTFEGKSFLANVREEKLVDLQNALLSDVVRSGNIKVRRVGEGTEDIKRRLSNLRVLVIVDDVDSVKQLEALAIKFYSFGPGSRIIITTRDQHLLKILKANTIYHLPAMNKVEALALLCWHTKKYPNKEFLQVSRDVVDYCGGLPLALEVLGSYLSGAGLSEWKSKLEKFKSHRCMEILNRLKISFDELADDDLKAIFLDMSCFFAGMNKDYVMKILDGCDLYPEIGISVLQERCLVNTTNDFTLVMHDLLRDMGRYTVHEESPDDPGKRSRLWHHDDVIDVLKNESGTEAIQGLTLDLQESDETSFSTEAFRNMHSLRLLKLNYVKLTGSYNNLPNELRWLCWHGFPLEAIPEDFDHPNIVVIDLSYSKLTRVWEDSNLLLEKLKFLNLSHSHNLTRSPDFSKTPNLERLILKDCKNLQAIPRLPTNLEILEADECIALEKMPDFSEMSRMRELHLNHSPKLSEILGLDKALSSNSMTSIHMEGCTNLTASFKEAILQGWSARGNGDLFLPGNEIPSWFTPVDPQGEIVVPQSFGCDLKALTVCIIYSSDDSQYSGSLRIRVANYTQNTVFLISPMRATVITCHENYLWLGHLSNNKLNVKGGDKINVGAHFVGPATTDDIHVRVKKIGINLEKEKLIKEYAQEQGSHKAEHSDDSSHENQSRKRLKSDSSVERNPEEETDEIMQEGRSMG